MPAQRGGEGFFYVVSVTEPSDVINGINTMNAAMFPVLGIPYVTDCIAAARKRRDHEESYKVYVTDCLYALCGFTGNKMNRRYFDLINPTPIENRPGDVIARERLESYGIEVV